MSSLTLRDHLWLWGMKVNVLQELKAYPFWEETSTLTQPSRRSSGRGFATCSSPGTCR